MSAALVAFLLIGIFLELLTHIPWPRRRRTLPPPGPPPVLRTYEPRLATLLEELAPYLRDGRQLFPRLQARARRLGLRRRETPYGPAYVGGDVAVLAHHTPEGYVLSLVAWPLRAAPAAPPAPAGRRDPPPPRGGRPRAAPRPRPAPAAPSPGTALASSPRPASPGASPTDHPTRKPTCKYAPPPPTNPRPSPYTGQPTRERTVQFNGRDLR